MPQLLHYLPGRSCQGAGRGSACTLRRLRRHLPGASGGYCHRGARSRTVACSSPTRTRSACLGGAGGACRRASRADSSGSCSPGNSAGCCSPTSAPGASSRAAGRGTSPAGTHGGSRSRQRAARASSAPGRTAGSRSFWTGHTGGNSRPASIPERRGGSSGSTCRDAASRRGAAAAFDAGPSAQRSICDAPGAGGATAPGTTTCHSEARGQSVPVPGPVPEGAAPRAGADLGHGRVPSRQAP